MRKLIFLYSGPAAGLKPMIDKLIREEEGCVSIGTSKNQQVK